jgi:hypothetical protein
VGKFVFKAPDSWSFGKHKQALATGMVYEIDAQLRYADGRTFKVGISPFDEASGVVLSLEEGQREVHLALVQMIPDDDAVRWEEYSRRCPNRQGGHLHLLYQLADRLPTPYEDLIGVFSADGHKDVSLASIKEQCSASPFLEYEPRKLRTVFATADAAVGHWDCGCGDSQEQKTRSGAYNAKFFASPIPISPLVAPEGYQKMNELVGPPLCTPLRAEMPLPVK